jgi:hypothetical protein
MTADTHVVGEDRRGRFEFGDRLDMDEGARPLVGEPVAGQRR